MKNSKLLFIGILTTLCCSSCEDYESTEDKAIKASEAFCECLETKSEQDCKKELNRNYGSEVNNNEFYRVFNSVNDCGVTIYKEVKDCQN